MKVTDYSDKIQLEYDPLFDDEIDIDAPYIDFNFESDEIVSTLPKSGVYDTLFYNDQKILIVNEVCEAEIRFYSTENPNENYRTGQKHFKGRITDIREVADDTEEFPGYKITVDLSTEYNAKVHSINVGKNYVEITKTRCIAILFFNEYGRVIDELVIPIADWFSSKVYLNTAYVIEEEPVIPYKVGDLVEFEYYKKVYLESGSSKHEIRLMEDIGRISDIRTTAKTYKDNDGIEQTIEYNLLYMDCSELYYKRVLKIASTVIKSMTPHVIVPEV